MKWRTMGAHSIAKKENLIETKKKWIYVQKVIKDHNRSEIDINLM